MYCAIIGDIVNSRNIENRADVQYQLEDILKYINMKYKDSIVAKFTITIGDEFQCLLNEPKSVLNIIDYIKMNLYPVKIRFGIGLGEMSTEIKVFALGSDGPAYHLAREAIEDIKQSDIKYEQPVRDTMIYATNKENNQFNHLNIVNSLLSVCYYIESKWSEKQRDIIKQITKEEKSHRELAKQYGITQTSISRRFNSSGYYTYKNAKEEAIKYIVNYWEGIHG
jgi:Trp operon repressor